MDQPTPKSNAPDSTPAFTLTEGQLRKLIREEVQAAIGKANGANFNPEASGGQKSNLSVNEAAEFARLAPSTIRLYIRKGHLKAHKVGRRVIIERGELDAFIRQNPTRG